MARLVWALFCEKQLTDTSGKNSYIGVFHRQHVRIEPASDAPEVREPLPDPIPCGTFVLAMYVLTEPGSPECSVEVRDPDGQPVGDVYRQRLAEHSEGQHSWHIRFVDGIPVRRSGIYTFHIRVESEEVGKAELPVDIEIEQ